MSDTSTYLREKMDALGWPRWGQATRLAEATGRAVQLTSRWLAEDEQKRVVPGPESCERIAAALGVDPDELLVLAGHRRMRPFLSENPVAAAFRDPEQARALLRIHRLWPDTAKRRAVLALLDAVSPPDDGRDPGSSMSPYAPQAA